MGLCLGWLAEIACGVAQRFRVTRKLNAPIRHAIQQVTKILGLVLLVAATRHVQHKTPCAGRFYAKEAQRRINAARAFVGPTLKRRLRGLSNSQSIATLAAMLREPQKLIAALIRRLRRGLTRILRYVFDFGFDELALAPCISKSGNDSS
ncbi:hypothetical protein U91I_01674 [alpha proteobacterium U9-1i]|nr:hypothetical protein U91I_01674 [alpha proteobacterium U9-1i]